MNLFGIRGTRDDSRKVLQVDAKASKVLNENVVALADQDTVVRVKARDKAFSRRLDETAVGKKRKGEVEPAKKQFWLWILILAVWNFFFKKEKVEAPVAKKSSASPPKEKVKFDWKDPTTYTSIATPVVIVVFAPFFIAMCGLFIWAGPWAAGIFGVLCGCLPAVLVFAVGVYVMFQKWMSRGDEEDEEDEKEKKK